MTAARLAVTAARRLVRMARLRHGRPGGNNGQGWGFAAGTIVTSTCIGVGVVSAKEQEDDDEQQCHRAEVIIIGGGIVGSAVACHLTTAGVGGVTLLERGSVGCEASGLSAGTIWNAGCPLTVRVEDSSLFLRARSAALLEALGECEHNRCGALDVAATEAEAALLQSDFEQQRRKGLVVEWCGHQDEIVALEPALAGGTALCATHTPLSGSVQPALATQRFAAVAASNGCAIIEGADVVSLQKCKSKQKNHYKAYKATTADGRVFRAKHVVIAAGAAAAPLADGLGVRLPVVPIKGVICSAHCAVPGALKKVIFDMGSRLHFREAGSGRDDASGVPALCTHDAGGNRRCRKLYGKQCGPSDNHMIIFGGDRLPGEVAKDYEVPAASSASIRANVRELLPSLHGFDDIPIVESDEMGAWTGLMPFSKDGRPIVGPLAHLGMPTCWLAVGFGPSGIMEGPYAAKLLAGRVAEHFGKRTTQSEDEADKVILQSLDPRGRLEGECDERVHERVSIM